MYLVLEVLQERALKEMLAIPYLVLQAWVSFLRCFRQEWRILLSSKVLNYFEKRLVL